MSKTCTQCHLDKPLSLFYKVHRGKYYMSECKSCYRARMTTRYQDPDVKKRDAELKLAHYQEDPRPFIRLAKKWRESHREMSRLNARCSYYIDKLRALGVLTTDEKHTHTITTKAGTVRLFRIPNKQSTLKVLNGRIKWMKNILKE